ncbi:hypothetical protein QWJ07_10915 [Frankia sp. RB7]|nr:hypothetical protein [Frankia sp. RB7]
MPKAAFACVMALTLGSCDLLEDSNPRPWIGYVYNKDANQLEWEWNDWKSVRDCKEALLHIIETRPGVAKPYGCAYRGNNYWRVWIMDTFWGGSEIACIARLTSTVEEKGGTAYNAHLKGSPERRGDNWYCV